jgi:hypothetical protein
MVVVKRSNAWTSNEDDDGNEQTVTATTTTTVEELEDIRNELRPEVSELKKNLKATEVSPTFIHPILTTTNSIKAIPLFLHQR